MAVAVVESSWRGESDVCRVMIFVSASERAFLSRWLTEQSPNELEVIGSCRPPKSFELIAFAESRRLESLSFTSLRLPFAFVTSKLSRRLRELSVFSSMLLT